MGEKFYITTPIYYINDRPHIGHAYTTIVADALSRFYAHEGKKVAFVAGTDENGQKTVDAARKGGESTAAYADRLAEIWKTTWRALGIANTDFIRTTEMRHRETVVEIWRRIWNSGDIYRGRYEGLYCRGHEAFLKESDLIDGECPEHKQKPELVSEENYFFRLSKYEKPLLELYEKNPEFIVPRSRYNEVRSFVRSGLEDLSISRESRNWGIPVPDDPSQVIYVWFDALINYVSAVGLHGWEAHPADIHAIGKDIVRFHAVIWPAMLLSAKLPLPGQVAANGFLTIDGVKISKTLGNAVDPVGLARRYGTDALRYYLLREVPYGEDGDFSLEKFRERYNADLANGLGNFSARVLALGEKLGKSSIRELDASAVERIEAAHKTVREKIRQFRFHEVLIAVWELIAFGDVYINFKRPWEKTDPQAICTLVAILDNVAAMVKPLLPDTSLRITKSIRWVSNSAFVVEKSDALFPRIAD
ncbi:methionine--tRNA ligase [Candidatus Parcubacteria bacterium]|nr:MAG: methionine--tRNA ligase [Candidatus Parcubacteria bacterium]